MVHTTIATLVQILVQDEPPGGFFEDDVGPKVIVLIFIITLVLVSVAFLARRLKR